MKKLSSSEIRQMFLDFFQEKGHTIEPSASLIPKDDPTLLWINSGVATMKKYFDGSEAPSNPRLTSSQKSIRTNDIENVGRTARHQTLFEMLGNFSIGDYFKKEVIPWAYELLTSEKWFGWDQDKLFVTVYPDDTETKELWEKAGIKKDHIIDVKDNFWDIGQGPSGPDSEIFYDRGEDYDNLADGDPENYPGGENERYLEVWNIVFSQFNHTPENTYEPLPRKNIDTGMGLERVVSIFQDAPTNFETDLFMPIIQKTEELSDHKSYGQNETDDVAFKVIADHIRAISFAIADGALPSNEGRGYVIRRLLRRATVNGHQLGIDEAFLYKLVPVVGQIMKSYYPEIVDQQEYIQKIVKNEEERFNSTLTDGMNLLNGVIKNTKDRGDEDISGNDAFKLYDTYGFPLDLTEEYAHNEGLNVDETGFEAEMQKQKERARNARGSQKGMKVQRDLLLEIKAPSEYVGYDQLDVKDAKLQDMIVGEKFVDKADSKDGEAELVFDKTPFYAEMGGQVADIGNIYNQNGDLVAEVEDVKHAPNGQNLHTVKVIGKLHKGDQYHLAVDKNFHSRVEKNHTATHLLDQSLRNVLGGRTEQAGSLVEPDYLRFDFTHLGQVTPDELQKVEAMVNEQIFAALPVTTIVTDQKTGKKMGAVALFDDKYGSKVRVVSAGNFSIEFCGGNHVKNTSELGLFKIISEAGVGAGIRRITAVTSKEAFDYLNGEEKMLNDISASVKSPKNDETPGKVKGLLAQIKDLESRQESLETKLANQEASDIFDHAEEINGTSLITGQLKGANMNQLRELADTWRDKQASDILVLGAGSGDKANLLVAVSEAKIKDGVKAGDLIKAIAPKINGGGGGRPNLAQAGGKNPGGIEDALAAAKDWVKDNLN